MRNYLVLTVLSLASAVAAAAPPQKIEIVYEVSRNDLVLAEVTQRLEHDGHSYRLTETTKGRGLLALRGDADRASQGMVAGDGLRPAKFEDKRSGRDSLHVEFDPASKTPTLQQQDQLSLMWSFAFAPPRAAAAVSVADGKRVTSYTYQPAGRERVKTPAGEFEALKFVKRRDNPKDKVTEVWFAIDRQNIPVRILVVDKDGNRIDTLAAKISAQ